MNICWIATILLSLCFSSTANMISSHIFDELHVVQVYVHGTASVCCPNLKGKPDVEWLYTLCRGDVEVGNHSYDHNHNYTGTVREGLRIQVNQTERTVKFVLSRITLKQAGLYTCKVQHTYPPPVEDVKEVCQTVVLVQENQCPAGKSPVCEGDVVQVWMWMFWISLSYGLAVTIISIVCCLRVRKEGSQSDYMNTRPRAPPRGLKKNQGVQHPVRMGRY